MGGVDWADKKTAQGGNAVKGKGQDLGIRGRQAAHLMALALELLCEACWEVAEDV